MWECPNCGAKNDDQSDSCPVCAYGKVPCNRWWIWLRALTVLALVAVIAFVLLPWLGQNRYQLTSQKQWISDTFRELEHKTPASLTITNRDGNAIWVTQDVHNSHSGFLLFSNGWAAYEIHNLHGLGSFDTAILRTSDGAYYMSPLHYHNLMGFMKGPKFETPPASFADFLQNYGCAQEWAVLSPDGRLHCAVVLNGGYKSPHPKRGKQTLNVWINQTTEMDGESNLYAGRLSVVGSYVCWGTRWLANRQIAVDICDYPEKDYAPGGFYHQHDPGLFYFHGHSNYLTTITFGPDRQTGRYTELK